MSSLKRSAAIVVASDRAYDGEREDATGPLLSARLAELGFSIIAQTIVPDDEDMIVSTLEELVDHDVSLIVTTGGTGLGPRDVTPEATLRVIEKQIPGLAEAMRRSGLTDTRFAMLSRAVVGMKAQTLIINLPGNPDGALSSLASIQDVLGHALSVMQSPSFDHDTTR